MIHVTDLHKSYRRGSTTTPVLSGVNMQVTAGECAFLVGPSGSGKSTLLSILGCILTPDRGEVRILGEDLTKMSRHERILLRRQRIGFVFQRFQLIRGLSAFDNIHVPLLLGGAAPRTARARVTQLLEAVGLPDQAAALPKNMSAGQCQRIALARALAADPDLILADEPTASLDAQNGREVMELLRRLIKERGKTAVVVTHDYRIFSYADRLLAINNGRVSESDAAGNVVVPRPGRAAPPLVGHPHLDDVGACISGNQ